MKYVNQPIQKKDAMALVTGQPVYTEDLAPKDCLVVKVLRSPHAHAMIQKIDKSKAMLIPGIIAIYTYEDVPQKRFTCAGQTYPEPSPYDRLILDQRVRYVGDAVAILAGKTEKAVNQAMKLIRVSYEVLPAVLDFRTALDNEVVIHPEDSFVSLCSVGTDKQRNLCASEVEEYGDVHQVMSQCDTIIEHTYHTKANQQAMMETFRAFATMDTYGRLNVTASTQVTFHVRRILANALDLPKSKIRVVKPRVGGGFGAKQTVVAELYPAFVTLKTGKPSMMIYTREESQIASTPRHEMEIRVRLGADKNGIIKAMDVYTLSNTGAYGEHGPTTVGLSGHKSIPLYGKVEAFRFAFDVVYTNVMSAGAYRGYGATQGQFAVESAVSELAAKLNIDPVELRLKNMVQQGQIMPAYYGEKLNSCALERCMNRAKQMIGWDEKKKEKILPNGRIRGLGVAMSMQGSGISNVDTAAVTIKLNDDGFYSLMIGASDIGTGCDTILSQMAADCLDCSMDNIIVSGVDTDISPYDSGSYASSTTYVTGMAVVKTCETLKKIILEKASEFLHQPVEELEFDGDKVTDYKTNASISLKDIANRAMCGNNQAVMASESYYNTISPPPFMVGIAEVEVEPETGKVYPIQYAAVVDCGTVVNPNLARVQAEGGIVQGIGMALYEDIVYTKTGHNCSNSFMQYKIPTRTDIGTINVEFESSYEPSGPFGAKSIGEVVINTPAPAIANAVYDAVGVRIRELPITSEKVYYGMQEKY